MAMNCDVLVHECTFDDSMRDRAEKSMHSTPSMVSSFASEVNPKNLIITHFSQRYTGVGVEITVNDLLEETKKKCQGISAGSVRTRRRRRCLRSTYQRISVYIELF